MSVRDIIICIALASAVSIAANAQAQPLGSFTWQLQPFCNRVTVNVRQDGAVYTLDGFDDQCGAGQRAPLVGLGTPNPDGTIGFGLHIVASGGKAVSIDARISLAGLGGTWTDSAGNTGTFAFGANTGGSPRPPAGVGPGDITAVLPGTGLSGGGAAGDVTLSVNPAVVQSRVTQTCPAGQAVRAVAQNGTVTCEPVSGGTGDITAVVAGVGLLGGATNGDATLNVAFFGPGTANLAARSDHTHATLLGANSTAIGPGALAVNSAADNTAVGAAALASNITGTDNVAVGRNALALSTTSGNTALGSLTLDANTSGAINTAVGAEALGSNTTGNENIGIGLRAGFTNTTGSENLFIGRSADAGTGSLTNASAIGPRARVDSSNALVLGAVRGVNANFTGTDVGIGTTSPTARLDIQNDVAGIDLSLTTAGRGPLFRGRHSNGTLATPTATGSGSTLLSMFGWGHTGAAFQGGGGIQVEADQAWGSLARGTRLTFYTTPNDTLDLQGRVVFDHDGEVGIGTSNPLDRLHVVGDIRVGTTGTNGCLKGNGGAAIAGTCSSDVRFKRDITPFGPALERVTALRPVHYFWRAAAFPEKGFGTEQTYGLIAQEVEQVLPEIVTTDADGFKAVDYAKLPLLLLQALRELKDENDALKARMATFEALRASSTPSPRKH